MPQWSGTPVAIGRMLGQVDQDDPTNLPLGCASTCKNTDFTRDSTGSSLSATTRAGNNLIMQGVGKSPGTGFWDFQYEPESATDPFFQQMLLFSMTGTLEREYPPGTGRMQAVPAGMFALPANSHKIDTQTANLVFSAYSSALFNPTPLKVPSAGGSCYNPKTLNMDPLGMKPYGFNWQPSLYVYAGEVVCPSLSNSGLQGNGHTYQAQNNGWIGLNEPTWPLIEGGEVTEVVAGPLTPVTWKELTMVIANRLPTPAAPAVAAAAGGAFGAGLDVYIGVAMSNGMGITLMSLPGVVVDTLAASSVNVTLPGLSQLAGWIQTLASPYAPTTYTLYVATVATGAEAPPLDEYLAYGSPVAITPGAQVVNVTTTGSGANPAVMNSARITPGQLPAPTTEAVLTRVPAGGTFAAGRDIWVRLSYANANGETPVGPSNSIINTLANDAVQVTLSAVANLPQLATINIYEVDVPTGSPEPDPTTYAKVGSFPVPSTQTITAAATGNPPVTVNTTGPGGNIAADTETGGINGGQGYRYAVPAWMNRNETISGFSVAAVSKYIVDEDGWEISVFNVPVGPANVIGRVINWTVADGTQDGPFAWIGLVDLQVPSQNQVYPNSYQSDGITIVPTIFLDNVTTSGTFNFTDEYLTGEIEDGEEGNNTTDRLTLMVPPQGVRVDYLLTCDRLSVCGVPGLTTGPVISLAGDYESFDGDTGPLPIRTNTGEICWGLLEYRNQIYAMRERSGVVLTPGTGEPSSWDAKARWNGDMGNGVGPCGPRAFAQNGQFIGFVHRTGFYKYDDTTPDMMTKEIPREWGTINWAAATTIAVSIDDDTHTVRIQVPVGNSLVPNKEFCLSYLEGWQNPIHFTTYSQKEVTQEASRRWSFNDFSAYICKRIYRTVANPPPMPLGADGTDQLGTDFYISQLAYTTTDASGMVNARKPGRFNDNGAGIDWVYEGTSAQQMQKPSKAEGVATSCVGNGPINVGFIAGRRRINDPSGPKRVLQCAPIILKPNSNVDFTSKPQRGVVDEYWRVRYDNGKQPDVWASLKKATVYIIPVRQARASG